MAVIITDSDDDVIIHSENEVTAYYDIFREAIMAENTSSSSILRSLSIRLSIQYAVVLGAFWSVFCSFHSYATVYLLSCGFNSATVGMLIAHLTFFKPTTEHIGNFSSRRFNIAFSLTPLHSIRRLRRIGARFGQLC